MAQPNVKSDYDNEKTLEMKRRNEDEDVWLDPEDLIELEDDDVEEVEEVTDDQIIEISPDLSSVVGHFPSDEALTPEFLANAKGIDIDRIPRSDGSLAKGKIIEWDIMEEFLCVGRDSRTGKFFKKRVPAKKLYELNEGLEAKINYYDDVREARQKLNSLLEDAKHRELSEATILDGGRMDTVERARRNFRMTGGIEGCVASSLAGYRKKKSEKTGLPKMNEDRAYVNPKANFAMVADGMGGGSMGRYCSQSLCQAVAANEGNPAAAAKAVSKQWAVDERINTANDGACFLSVNMDVGKPLEVNQAGDVDLYHFSASGNVKYSPDMNKKPQSAFGFLEKLSRENADEQQVKRFVYGLAGIREAVNNEADAIVQRILNKQRPFVEMSNPYFGRLRSVVVNAVNQDKADVATYQTPEIVESGDWVVLMSDGVADNLLPGELQSLVQGAMANGWNPEELTIRISELIDERMKKAEAGDPEAKQKRYKLDNATIIVMRANSQVAGTAARVA